MRWACLLFPRLALDALLRLRTDPDVAHALVTGPPQRRLLHSVNAAALRAGLHRGMPLATARLQVPSLQAHRHDPAREAAARATLAAWAYGFSAQVSLALAHAVVLEIGASSALFGDWGQLGGRLASELRALGFHHRQAAAPNPQAAWVLARARLQVGVDALRLEDALGQVPLERSGLPATAITTLRRSGLRHLRQVFALDRGALARRFPPDVLDWLDALRAQDAPPLPLHVPPRRFDARIDFEHDVESSQALLFPLRRLTSDLAAFLSCRDGGVQRFTLLFEHDHHPATALDIGLLAPEREAAVLFELARSRLERLRLPDPARGMRLIARQLPPFVPAARDLFDPRPQQALPWEQLRERLRARLGDAAVRAVVLHADHRPERATHPTGAHQTASPAAPRRPAWLLSQPMPLRGEVRIIDAPERIEAGWWDGDEIRRDYAIVRTSRGQDAWAFRTPDVPGQWFLHGWFA